MPACAILFAEMILLTYEQAVAYIHSLLVFGIKPGLERINILLERLGNPQDKIKFFHVAGTNGKGSTSTMLSNALISAGYKTGLFTSPYVFDFCERIKIDGENIPKSDLADIVSRIKPVIDELSEKGIVITEFEAITAAALLYFYEQKCDYAVMEVGLGGRFDATNVIKCPEVAVITSISKDHTKILGDTVEKIAFEKCGIIKENSTVVTTSLQDEEALMVIEKKAKEKNARLIIADFGETSIISKSKGGTDFVYKGNEYFISLDGRHQVENAIGVVEAARLIDGVGEKDIVFSLKNTVMHGRMELISDNVLIDGGHNEECSKALSAVLESEFSDKNITAVIGMMADKDCEKYLSNVLPHCKRVIFTKPDNPRSEEPERLCDYSKKYIDKIDIEIDPKIAYHIAVESSPFVLVCGSFYLISDIFKDER